MCNGGFQRRVGSIKMNSYVLLMLCVANAMCPLVMAVARVCAYVRVCVYVCVCVCKDIE